MVAGVSIFPLFGWERVRRDVMTPTRCRNGHELTPDNLTPAERSTRWRCRECRAERGAAWRHRRRAWRRQLCCMVQGALVEPGRGRSACSSGKSVLAACTLVQNIQHSRAEARATPFRPIEKVPKGAVSSRLRRRTPPMHSACRASHCPRPTCTRQSSRAAACTACSTVILSTPRWLTLVRQRTLAPAMSPWWLIVSVV